jgi:hypothetical protein
MRETGVAMNNRQPEREPSADHLRRLADRLEAMRIADYLELLGKPRKLVLTNFIAGIARGLGFAIGTTIVFAIVWRCCAASS